MSARSRLFTGHRQAEDRWGRGRTHARVYQPSLRLSDESEGENGSRTGDRRYRLSRRVYRPTQQPGALRARDRAGGRSLLGNQATVGAGWPRHPRRPKHSGKHQSVRSLAEPSQVAMDNGARRALVPLENKRNFFEVSGDIVERVDPIFFSDPMTAAMKALGMT
jgi:hypothetical protein